MVQLPRVLQEEVLQHVFSIAKVCWWLPLVVTVGVAFPLDQVLNMPTLTAAVQYLFNLIFLLITNDFRRWALVRVVATLAWLEQGNMEDRVYFYCVWEL